MFCMEKNDCTHFPTKEFNINLGKTIFKLFNEATCL